MTLNRTAGDLLVTYDFGGSGTPTLGLLTWVTSGATSQCFSANSLPCWGNRVDLSAAGAAEGAVNTGNVTDPINPGAPRTLTAGLFGEAAIDLTKAGVFPAGTCKGFGSTFLKSRSSSSFGAEVKDFIAPQPVNISNCGNVTIIKHTDPRGVNQVFSYTSNLTPNSNAGGVACTAGGAAGVAADGSFCLNDSAGVDPSPIAPGPNTVTEELFAGTYTVTEGAEPNGFQFKSLTCTGGTTSINGETVTITLAPNDNVVCTYVNQQQTGALKILKTSSKAAATPLAGATFLVKDPNGNTVTTSPSDSNGVICVDGLTTLGDYTVEETAAPTGYAVDDSTVHTVTVTGSNAKCSDSTFTGQSLTFKDTPLTDITVHAKSQATGGTQSTITCTTGDPSTFPGTNIGNSPQGPNDPADVAANGLAPGTYTCTIVIDP
jgi:hypothetical protein